MTNNYGIFKLSTWNSEPEIPAVPMFFLPKFLVVMSFPDSPVRKEATCNAGDLSSIPMLGRSPGERIGYPLQHSWASLVAQSLKRLPAMRETQVQSLVLEDILEKEVATHSRTLAWKIPWREKPGRLQSMGSQRVKHD